MSIADNNELDFLKKRCFIFYEYYYEKYGHSGIFLNAKLSVEQEYTKGNLTGLRLASNDMNNWLKEMPLEDCIELAGILKSKLKEDIFEIAKNRLMIIKKVLKKGKITNDKEFELLADRANEIFSDENRKKELSNINQLLKKYSS